MAKPIEIMSGLCTLIFEAKAFIAIILKLAIFMAHPQTVHAIIFTFIQRITMNNMATILASSDPLEDHLKTTYDQPAFAAVMHLNQTQSSSPTSCYVAKFHEDFYQHMLFFM